MIFFFFEIKALSFTQYQKDTLTRIPYHFIFWKSENPLKSYNILSFQKFNYLCATLLDFFRTRIKSAIYEATRITFFQAIVDIE
jgi:hypothetical protein